MTIFNQSDYSILVKYSILKLVYDIDYLSAYEHNTVHFRLKYLRLTKLRASPFELFKAHSHFGLIYKS